MEVGQHIYFLTIVDSANVGDVAKITGIFDDEYSLDSYWMRCQLINQGKTAGFRVNGNGYILNDNFRLATYEEIWGHPETVEIFEADESLPNCKLRKFLEWKF